jgi:5-methylcytosine-specific restriction endonuclease McrA
LILSRNSTKAKEQAMSRDVHAALARALEDLRTAEKSAVLLFAEVMVNELYRDLGFASMERYSEEKLGFSPGKTKQFMRLAARLEELPELKRAVEAGDIGWTAARHVQSVATANTEAHWVEEAKRTSRRELTRKIDRARAAAKRERARKSTGQAELLPIGAGGAGGAGAGGAGSAEPIDVPRTITFTFTGEQYDRYVALIEARRKAGCRSSREELILEALASTPVGASSNAPHHKIVTTVCPKCGAAATPGPGGDRTIPLPELAARIEDAEMVDEQGNTRRTIPPKVRAQVLARDGHMCQARGCGNTQFLTLHHKTPVSVGGTNEPDNLTTMCSRCHRALHERKRQLASLQRGTRVSGDAMGLEGTPSPNAAAEVPAAGGGRSG